MKPKYCSIDLEFTGFDPEKEQILEIGFAFFDIGKNGFEVTETWSQVFKPSIEVHPKILGLTGITQEEIDVAPNIADHRDFLSEKLHDAILVAHNPTLDVKFLEMAGVKLSGKTIDSLELVQFLLPTHHSYNLENLMHYFGIEHKDSHRALADCLSTISLVEKMVGIHSSFSEQLKSNLHGIVSKADFTWAPLLQLDFQTNINQVNDSLSHEEFADNELKEFSLPITIDKDHYLHESRVANTLRKQDGKWLLVMQNKKEVMRLWQAGLVEGVFQAKDLFDSDAFNKFVETATSPEELRFILKIFVWLETNWQTTTVLDLNLSFFGGQFKSFITGSKIQASDEKVLACDYDTLLALSENKIELNRKVLICELQNFEKFLTSGSRSKMSWNYFNYILKSVYNPETEYGNKNYKDEVIQAMASVDLFFGLVQLILRQNLKQLDYISLDDLESLYGVFYNRLNQAAQSLSGRLSALGGEVGSDSVVRLGDNLSEFFKLEENYVKWIELTEDNAILHSQPIEIKGLVRDLLRPYQDHGFTDTLIQKHLLFYFAERLGLDTEIVSGINDFRNLSIDQVRLDINSPVNVLANLAQTSSPLAIVFLNTAKVKSFYKDHYLELGKHFRVLAQDYSGSGNKIFRNFRIFPNALLLATSAFINRQEYRASSGAVLYLDWPEIDSTQPYIKSLVKIYEQKFPKLLEILTFSSFILNLKQLSGQDLPKIYLSEAAEENFVKSSA